MATVSILIPLKEMVSDTLSSFRSCFFTIALIVLIAELVDSSPVGWSTRVLPRYLAGDMTTHLWMGTNTRSNEL